MKIKTIILTIFSLLTALLLAAAVLGGVIYFRAAMYGQAELLDATHVDAAAPELGRQFELEIFCQLPWSQQIKSAEFELPTGLVQTGKLQIEPESLQLHGQLMHIAVPVKAYRTGELPPVRVQVEIERPMAKNQPEKVTLQQVMKALKIQKKSLNNAENLPIADAIVPEQAPPARSHRTLILIIAGAVLLVIFISGVIIYRKKRRQRATPPREEALRQLQELKLAFARDPGAMRQYVQRLIDILRNYISDQFQWPIRTFTTVEFINHLQNQQLLSSAQTDYIKDFMQTSDLIRFANFTPSADELTAAIDQVELFVKNSSLPPDQKPNQEKKQ